MLLQITVWNERLYGRNVKAKAMDEAALTAETQLSAFMQLGCEIAQINEIDGI